MAHWDRFESCAFEPALFRSRFSIAEADTFPYNIPIEFAAFSSANAARCWCCRAQFLFSILFFSVAVVAKFCVSCTKHFRSHAVQQIKNYVPFIKLFRVEFEQRQSYRRGLSSPFLALSLSFSVSLYMWSAKDTSAKPYFARTRKSSNKTSANDEICF